MIKSYNKFLESNKFSYSGSEDIECRLILQELREKGITLNESEKKILDDKFNEVDFYDRYVEWFRNKIEIFKSINIEDLNDRLVEFSDIIGKQSNLYFSMSSDGSFVFINLNIDKIFYKAIGTMMMNSLYQYKRVENNLSAYELSTKYRASLYIDLIPNYTTSPVNLEKLEDVADKIISRFKSLYSIKDVQFSSFNREGRKYDTNIDVHDYSFVLYLE
jgi:hypothetical protein